jgi:RNA polymerase sigma factor (sigma-70 family)
MPEPNNSHQAQQRVTPITEHRAKKAQTARAESDLLTAFQKHHSALKRFIARYLRSHHDIEDVAQESFLRAFRAGMEYDVRQPKSFLFRIAKNVAISQLRSKSRQITDSLEEQAAGDLLCSEWTLEEDMIARERLGAQCEAVAALPPQCRRVYMLRKVHGMSHKEIALQLGISQKTVEKHLYKGIAACDRYVRQALNTEPHEPSDYQQSNDHQENQSMATNRQTSNTKEGKAHG